MNKKIANDRLIDSIFIVFGIAGALIILYGLNSTLPKPAYALGSILLFATAAHFKLVYFLALELIQTTGHIAALLNVSPHIQAAIPVLLSLQILLYYFMTGPWNTFVFFGVMGIMLLSIGFAYENQYIYLLGALGIASYAYYCAIKGESVCFLWAILNTIFAISTTYHLITQG